MMKRFIFQTALFIFVLTFVSIFPFEPVCSQIPRSILYQGTITDTLGKPVSDGTYFIRFRIWSDSVSNDIFFEKWNGNIQTFSVVGGLIEANLGASPMPSLPSNLFNTDSSFYLGLTIGSGLELRPRIKFAAVPYAYKALISDTSKIALGVLPNSITGAGIADGSIGLAKLSQNGASSGNVMAWSGSQWQPTAAASGTGDITSISVGGGLSGGGDSGDISIYILPEAITSVQLGPNSVGNSELQPNSVGSSNILPGAVGSSDLAVSSVGTSEIADNSVTAIDIFDEPGIAQGRNVNTVSFESLVMTDLVTLTITIPSPGFVVLNGRTNLRMYGATNSSLALVQIDTASGGTELVGQYSTVGFSSYPTTGDYSLNCTSQRTFFKNTGTYTFRLEGRKIISVPQSQIEASTSILTAVFYPTSYGGVQTASESANEPPKEK